MVSNPKALDLFCCAGGAGYGLMLAGYDVTGYDINPQPRYPGHFIQGDAFDVLGGDLSAYDLIWASPKCQAHSRITPKEHKARHEIQLPRVLEILRAQSTPYIVENVEGTQIYMQNPIFLCGTMFGLNIWRHRWFEIGNVDMFFMLPPCNHSGIPVLISGTPRRKGMKRVEPTVQERRDAIGIQWMTGKELDQAIPPAYSKFLAEQIRGNI